MELTTEQTHILAALDQSFRIMAGAGSGKTTTLTLFVRALIDIGRARAEEIAFITFTRLAAQDILKKVRKLIPGARICCGTFHKVMFRFIAAAGLALPDPVTLYDGCMERNVEFVIQQMRDLEPRLVAHLRTYRVLVVDEFQDLDPSQFEFIALFRRIQPALQIIAIGDLAQNIYRFRGTSNEFLRRLLQSEIVQDLRTYRLTMNFRSNAAILNAVNNVFAEEIRNEHVLPMVVGKPHIPSVKPQYYEYTGEAIGNYEVLVVDTILPIIKAAKAACKSIVLIFPVIKCVSYEIITALLSAQLHGTHDFHRISKEDATTATTEIPYEARDSDSPIQLATFHASKGLEWDVVILVNVSDDVYDLRGDDVEDEGFLTERTNLLYVGMTRAIEQLFIFGNTRMSGRHRLLARIGSQLEDVMDVKNWIDEDPVPRDKKARLSGVSDLVRRCGQYPDIYKRFIACSEHIAASFHKGEALQMGAIYTEMKLRNRELAFGTFMDWMIKRTLTNAPTIQCRMLELLFSLRPHIWFHKSVITSNIEVVRATVLDFFDRVGNLPNSEIDEYITAVRWLANYLIRKFAVDVIVWNIYHAVENRIMEAYKKPTQTIRDLYILSQTTNFYTRCQASEIRAVDEKENSYQGLPRGFDEFATAMVVPAAAIIKAAVGKDTAFRADINLETESLIVGEIDLLSDEECVIEIKCGAATSSADLRGTSNNVNLLQLLAYVAMSRHGTIPVTPRWKRAILINPMTATWESYDLESWSLEQSAEFMACLEEIRQRG
jgi:hypothetical protein